MRPTGASHPSRNTSTRCHEGRCLVAGPHSLLANSRVLPFKEFTLFRQFGLTTIPVLLLLLGPLTVLADSNGPTFGFSTATLGVGDIGVGTEVMWRAGTTMLAPQFMYGWKPNLQISISGPFHLDHGDHPTGRFMADTPGDPSIEGMLGWRFYHSANAVGSRNEATLYGGFSALTQRVPRADGPSLARQPGVFGGLAVGHVTHTYDVWIGGGYQHYARWTSDANDHQSDSLLSSFVLGWRPAFINGDQKPDIRVFWETTAEKVGLAKRDTADLNSGSDGHDHGGTTPPPADANGIVTLPASGGTGVFSGPTFLVTYKSMSFQGGVLLPLLDEPNGGLKHERYRAAVGFTYYFLGHRR